MSLHSLSQYARQSLGNNKNNPNFANHKIKEEDIISSIDPSIVFKI